MTDVIGAHIEADPAGSLTVEFEPALVEGQAETWAYIFEVYIHAFLAGQLIFGNVGLDVDEFRGRFDRLPLSVRGG